MFHHENLDVYSVAIGFVRIAHQLVKGLPRTETAIRDQVKRAALSIPLNVAEGAGKVTLKERKHYYAIARGSALECAAALDVLKVLELRPAGQIDTGKELLVRIVSMLSKLCR